MAAVPFLAALVSALRSTTGWLRVGLACLLLGGVGRGYGQSVPPPASPGGAALRFEAAGRHKLALPVLFERNLIIVSARLNGAGPFNFLVDTGAGTSLLTDPTLADSLRLPHGESFRVVGAGGEPTELLAYQTKVDLSLAGTQVQGRHFPVLVLSDDVLNLSGYVGLPIHGILGAELFESFVVRLLPEQQRLVLVTPARYRAPRGRRWEIIPLTLSGSKAYLTTPVQLSDSLVLPLKLVLDTGAGHALSLETSADARLRVPARCLRAELGRGLNGVIQGQLGRVSGLQLGRYRVPGILTSFPDPGQVHGRAGVFRHGNLGLEVLKRFSLVIDYPHQRLLLRPNLHFAEPFEHDMCGLDLLAAGADYRRYVVLRVAPGSPAARAGICPDEELVSINLLPASLYSLTQLSRLLHSQDGRRLMLLLRRPDGELHTAVVQLKRQI